MPAQLTRWRRYRPVRSGRLAAAALAAAAIALTAGPARAVTAPAVSRPHATPAAASTAAASIGARPVLLLNGDRLAVRPGPGGRSAAVLLPAPGAGGVLSLGLGARTYDIPDYALPYLGRGLEPSLFELSALQRAESGGRLRVQVGYSGHRPVLPGVTFTRYGAGRAEGYLTASSARVFGAALERQFRADHGSDGYGTDGLFADHLVMAVAGAPASAMSRPAGTRDTGDRPGFALHTLTVHGTNLAGGPDTGDSVLVINADNWHTFGDPIESDNSFYHGAAKFSVPAGHYWASAFYDTPTKAGAIQRLVILPQFTVRRTTAVRIAERSATSRISAVTPRPAVLRGAVLEVIRGGQDHTASTLGSLLEPGYPLLVSPTTTKPTAGTLRTYTAETLGSRAGAPGVPYAYNLDFAGPPGIVPGQRWTAAPGSLAIVHERYYQDVTSTGGTLAYGGYLPQFESVLLGVLQPVPLPGLQTEYMTGGRNAVWLSGYDQFLRTGTGGQTDTNRRLLAGQRLTQNWNQYPLALQAQEQLLTGSLGRVFQQYPSALRYGNQLWLNPVAFSDNQPGHTGQGFFADGPHVALTGSYALYQNGKEIAHGNPANPDSDFLPPIQLSPRPAALRFEYSAGRWGKVYPHSPASQTTWTWRSVAQPHAQVPATWSCAFASSGRRCAAQPLMTLTYQVHGMALDGQTAPGRQVIGLRVGYFQPATGVPATSAGAWVSWDEGQLWRRAAVTAAGAGRFRISFRAPAGVDVTLRVSADGAAGNSITETVLRAYGVGF
jgi:hypothetical protein